MSNDRELLELAAKAAGVVGNRDSDGGYVYMAGSGPSLHVVKWHPLKDDEDAFRLAVKLDISLRQQFAMVVAEYPCVDAEFNERNTICEGVLDDHCASSRRVIVRAAAAMAKTTA
jgi:hypothetical protein